MFVTSTITLTNYYCTNRIVVFGFAKNFNVPVSIDYLYSAKGVSFHSPLVFELLMTDVNLTRRKHILFKSLIFVAALWPNASENTVSEIYWKIIALA